MKLSRAILSVLLAMTMLMTVSCSNTEPNNDDTGTTPPETEAAGTNAPETEVPETEAPETEAPETEPVEEARTIEIGTVDELLAFAKSVNEDYETYEGDTVLLTADIDLEGVEWTPIGFGNPHNYGITFPMDLYFGGTFDGQGHVIKNLVLTSYDGPNVTGFFGLIYGATIKNVGLEAKYNVVATATTHFNGHLVGWAMDSTIDSCYVIGGGLVEGSTTGVLQELGGIVGVCASATANSVTNCYFNGVLGGDMGGYTVGGIVGYTPNQFPELYVENCYTNGVTWSVVQNEDNFGGIWSCTEQDQSGGKIELVNCYTTATRVYGTRYENGADLFVTDCEANLTVDDITAEKLGSAFVADTENINGGFPILAWQQK